MQPESAGLPDSVHPVFLHIVRYGLTTVEALAWLFHQGDAGAARDHAKRLAAEGWLNRRYLDALTEFYELTPIGYQRAALAFEKIHGVIPSDQVREFRYKPIGGIPLIRAYQLLNFCCCDRPKKKDGRRKVRHRLLSHEVAEAFPKLVRFAYGEAVYYMEPGGQMLGLCWVDARDQPRGRLAVRCRETIEKQMEEEAIIKLIEADRFVFTLVVPRQEKKQEMRRLLRSEPLPLECSIVVVPPHARE